MTDKPLPRTRQREIRKGGLKIIEGLAEKGARHLDVAMTLGMSASTWTRVRQTNQKANDAWERGRGKLRMALVAALLSPADGVGQGVTERNTHKLIVSGNLKFLWNNLFGSEVLPAVTGGTMQVTINLPAPMAPADYTAKVIPGTAETIENA